MNSVATSHPMQWTAAELLQREGWRRPMPEPVLAEVRAFLATHPAAEADTFVFEPTAWPRLVAFATELRAHLFGSDGVCWLRGLDAAGPGDQPARILFAAIGSALGTPMLQYGRLYPVVDRGASYRNEPVPVSMTNAETCFHTDSSSVDVVPDLVGLLCEQPSDSGGDSLVSNALAAIAELQRTTPWALPVLQQAWIRDVVTPGRERTQENLLRNRFPVFTTDAQSGEPLFRYMRYWLEVGQEKAGAPLDAVARTALDALDTALADPRHVVRFKLARGEAMWVNNRCLAHNRTAYQDRPGNQRRLQRMWIRTADA